MPEEKKCTCPLCAQKFTPEDGATPEEHIAKGIIRVYREMQDASLLYELPCPRCGHNRMRPEHSENSISRHIDAYICPECGEDEARRDEKGSTLPLSAWFAVNEILKSVPGVRCADYIPEKNNPYPLCDNPGCEKSTECTRSAHMQMNLGDE